MHGVPRLRGRCRPRTGIQWLAVLAVVLGLVTLVAVVLGGR